MQRIYSILSLMFGVILKHLSKGLSYKMVANEMVISLDTVRTYVKRIYEKLRVHSITEAVHKVFIEKKD